MAIAYEISHHESILRIQMNPGREGNRAVLIPSCFEVAWLAGSCVNCPKWKHKMDVFGDMALSVYFVLTCLSYGLPHPSER